MSATQHQISVWGRWKTLPPSAPEDFLWHDTVERLPQVGDVVTVIGSVFQIEAIELSADEEGLLHILSVRPYEGTNLPVLQFGSTN